MDVMSWLVILVFIIGVIFFLLKNPIRLGSLPTSPYERESALFTPAERSFYGVLCQATEGKAVVFGKVRVADVLKTRKGLNASERQKAFNKISSKHFDYVLCKPDDLSITATVELDDVSHNSKTRRSRDQFLEDACKSADLKLHRFKASKGYSINAVQEVLFPSQTIEIKGRIPGQHLEETLIENSVKHEAELSAQRQVCPKCSSDLVRRVAKKGENKGEEFFACSSFPKCRYVFK